MKKVSYSLSYSSYNLRVSIIKVWALNWETGWQQWALAGHNREIYNHVYDKRRTLICFSLYFSFSVRYFYANITSFTQFLSTKIVPSCFHLLISYFDKFPTWIWLKPFALNLILNISYVTVYFMPLCLALPLFVFPREETLPLTPFCGKISLI